MSIKTILLIEHEDSLREVLSTCLTVLGGWRVVLSTSIQEGINLCAKSRLDAILLDASTPENDALLFIEQLKQRSISQSIPILLISARASWFTAEQLHQMGFTGAIEKPFNPATLAAQISHLLASSHPDL